jgi:hypothetical protein
MTEANAYVDEVELDGGIMDGGASHIPSGVAVSAAGGIPPVGRGRGGPPPSQKDLCYRCGGSGHFHALCVSPPGSAETNAPQCYLCMGRGHVKQLCPNNLPPNTCYRCGTPGHRSRYGKKSWGGDGGWSGGGGGADGDPSGVCVCVCV